MNCQGDHGHGRHPHRELPDPARALQPGTLVARRRRHPGDRRALPGRGAAALAQSGAGTRGAAPLGEVRHRRRRRAAAARGLREALRLSADRGVGHDRDRTPLRRRGRAAADHHARVRASGRRLRGARGRRRRSRRVPRRRRASCSCAGAGPRDRATASSPAISRTREATAEAWRGGWFHTGDVVRQAADGMLYFVDRKKNIIRRAGENIAAAEVEAMLQAHEAVAQVAVLAVPDEIREEEVMACVVVMAGVTSDRATGRGAVRAGAGRGWPTSRRRAGCCSCRHCRRREPRRCRRLRSSRGATDPRQRAGAIDLRDRKRRG